MGACTAGCATQDHATYGACLRGKGVRVAWCNSANGLDATREKKADAELTAYADAKKAGIQPAGTSMRKFRAAVELSNHAGAAYRADTKSFA